MEHFSWQFTNDATIYVPRVYRETTTSRILTMEYIDGIKISELDRLENEGFNLNKIAIYGADLMMKQIFIHGFFHADPHPGNVFILPNNIICYLDFGMVGRVNRKTRENFVNLVIAIEHRDESKAADSFLKLTYWEKKPDMNVLERGFAEFIDQHFFLSLEEMDLSKLLPDLLKITSRYQLRMHPNIFMMLKALITVHRIGRSLDPDFNITKHTIPFLRSIRLDRFRPQRLVGEMVESGMELVNVLQEIPKDLREIVSQFKQGRIKIEFEHRGLEPMLTTHDRISSRIAFAIVLASLVIGSSLIVLSKVPPIWREIPVIGLCGFLIAGVMSFWLLVSILRGGKL